MRFACIILSVFLMNLYTPAVAQDANYWSASYGPAGYFMPGAVISQNGDSGVLFYNPALLVNMRSSTSSLSGTIYQWQRLLIKNGLGTGLDLKSSGTSIVPMVASHTVPYLQKRLPFALAYAIVHTPVIDYGTTQAKDVVQDVLDNSYSPGPETFIGQYKAENRIDQTSFQAAAGIAVRKNMSAGITAEIVTHKQTTSVDYIARAQMNPAGPDTILAPITNVSDDYTASYRQTGFRAKIGMAWDITPQHHVGLLVTTPVWRLLGKGTVISNLEINNLSMGGFNINLLASTRQTKLKTNWKNPLSIAAAYTYMHQRGQLYFCAEYFAPLKNYSVLVPARAAYVRPDTGSSNSSTTILRLNDGRRAVLNAGIGASYRVSDTYLLFASVRTDFSSYSKKSRKIMEGYDVNVTNWDLYHAQIGASVKKKKFHLRTGLLLSYGGTGSYEQTINLDKPDESNYLLGETGITKARTLQAGVLVSYIHNF